MLVVDNLYSPDDVDANFDGATDQNIDTVKDLYGEQELKSPDEIDFGFGSFDFKFDWGSIDLSTWLSHMNYFILAFILLHTAINLITFRHKYFVVAPVDCQLQNQDIARKALIDAAKMWFSYFPCLALYNLHLSIDGSWGATFGVVAVLAFAAKFIFLDLPKTPLVDIFKGQDSTLVGTIIGRPINAIKALAEKFKNSGK